MLGQMNESRFHWYKHSLLDVFIPFSLQDFENANYNDTNVQGGGRV